MLLRRDQRPVRARCEARLDELPAREEPHFDTALELALGNIRGTMRGARLVPGATSGMVRSALASRARAGDRVGCTRVLERAIPAAGPVHPVLGMMWGAVAIGLLWALSQVSVTLAAIVCGAAVITGLVLVALGMETVMFAARLATSRPRRRALALSAEVTRKAAAGATDVGAVYDELAGMATGSDAIIAWGWAQAIEAVAAMDSGELRARGFEDARRMIEADRVPPGAAPALVRALVAAARAHGEALSLLKRLVVIAPEIGVLYRDAREEIERRQDRA
jgi:hypothetical protein